MAELDKYLAEVSKSIVTLTPEEAIRLHKQPGVCFIDLRDGYELMEHGIILGAEHCPRGSLEFRIPKDSPWHRPCFSGFERYIFYCSHGQRSVLGTLTAMEYGLKGACHISGGMRAWGAAGGPVAMLPRERD